MIRDAVSSDAAELAEIYNHYVVNTVVTFEEEPVSADTMAARLADVQALGLPWLVFEGNDQGVRRLLAYAYAARWKPRSSYRFSVEITVYAAPDTARRGLGSALYTELFQRLRTLGVHAAVGGIALPNEASVALHEKFGMTQIAQFREIGFKAGRWIDVGYWQLIL
jgi:L-amino acid N-acyltransferase YncA